MASDNIILAPAKVNLHLGVHAQKDERGYHRVDSVMIALDLADVVSVHDANGLSVTFEPAVDAPLEKTTTWRAARLLADELGVEPDVAITIERHIPEQAGLGGSSADAGAEDGSLAACQAPLSGELSDARRQAFRLAGPGEAGTAMAKSKILTWHRSG